MATLQEQYNLIKEGKGDKQHFLKQAKYLFPEYVTSLNDFDTTVSILKNKSLLSEAAGGVTTGRKDWFKIFDENLAEAVGVKNQKEYGDQNEFEKINADVQKALDHQFNNKDPKNIDNVYGQAFLLGFLQEMDDPKNVDKTVTQLKDIVAKNMAKDITYYTISKSKDIPGVAEPKAPKGKYKASGYGDLDKKK